MKKLFSVIISIFALCNCAFAVDYSKYNVSDINAIRKATKAYQNEFKNKKGTKEAEDEFLKFTEFYARAVSKQNEMIYDFPYKAKDNSFQKQAQEYSKKYYNKGLMIQFDEGEFFVVQCNRYIEENFQSYLTPDWQELLKFQNCFDKRIISDGRYVISKAELIKILEFYKNFAKKYPNFIKKENIKNTIQFYQRQIKQYPNVFS